VSDFGTEKAKRAARIGNTGKCFNAFRIEIRRVLVDMAKKD